jgi:DNA/RNA-binding domain of Phe-tRNA-synthetase-like protein
MMIYKVWADEDGASLSVYTWGDGQPTILTEGGVVELTSEQKEELIEFLKADS